MHTLKEEALKIITELPNELLQEVIDFAEFLKQKSIRKETKEGLLLQQKNLEKIWTNEEEDLYEI